jgi:azurin
MNRSVAVLCLALLAVVPVSPELRADDEKKDQIQEYDQIHIQANDQMKFDVASIDAAPGQKIRVTLVNTGTLPKAAMAHNFILLKAGTDVSAFAAAAMTHPETGYVPPEMADKVIVATKMLGPGESDTVSFTAPAAGTYDYICSFPGHALAGMRGTLIVK